MRCIACGCTEDRACIGGCSWVSATPPKCSACFDVDGEPLATGSANEGEKMFGIEYCPASETPAPHQPLFVNETTCYCARCRMELAA